MKKWYGHFFLVSVLLVFLTYVGGQLFISTLNVPSFIQISQQNPSSFIQILARDGSPIETVRADFQQRRLAWQPLKNYSERLQSFVLLSEDKRFYQHSGVDGLALLSALRGVLLGERGRGASTISMQIVGMIIPELQRQNGSRTYQQKILQMFYAQALEQHWSKEQILEAYLNLVPLRGEIVGMAAGAQTFFQKYPAALNERESAVLAAMLRAPNVDKETLIRRTCDLLLSHHNHCDYLDTFVANMLGRSYKQFLDTPADAPHLASQLIKAYQQSGVSISHTLYSTIDKSLQRFIQQRIQSRLVDLFQEKASDAAVVVLDNQTGEVLAYVGSSGHLSAAQHVDHANAPRQAGSTLKPFLYAQAIAQKHLTAASLLNDDVLSLDAGSGLYVPQNYDRRFNGWVSVRTALASSLNIPAVKTLTMLGIDDFRDKLVELGLPLTETGEFYGYSLALGSSDVTLLSLTNAYRVLANLGVYSPVRWMPKSLNKMNSMAQDEDAPQNNETTNYLNEKKRVFSPESSWIIGNILSDRYARVLTFGADSALSTPFWAAVKTGTSKDMRDNWAIGWSSRYTVGVWVGNSAGASMRNVSGVSGAAPIWHDVMAYLHKELPSIEPPKPETVVAEDIHYRPAVEPTRKEYFIAGTQMQEVHLSATRGTSVEEGTLATQNVTTVMQTTSENLAETDITASDTVASIFISTPTNGTIIAWDPDIPKDYQQLKMEARQINHILPTQVYWVLNGVKIGRGNPFYWPLKVGRYTLGLFAQDGRQLDEVMFQVR
ncbi:penicillin-binding protein 1C [Pelistega europaea]|uniref:peptidoglycan glycosyltransferase n=1 Tax=Pelistega europaea TaxID=106147 RepID=A0A7Y4LBN3_9BURK|nr:penicillin-binding protein 1C [Pelistega europaea]NOL50498.1 penicillin-binding protein 1C [Pelistega europaea]